MLSETHGPDVALIRWPQERERLERARHARAPRLLLVEEAASPPTVADPLEDWVRLPAPQHDVAARVRTLEARAIRVRVPDVADGVLRFGEGWTSLSPVEERLADAFSRRFGAVVGREALVKAVWPENPPSRNALDVHVLRLRRRIEALGLEIRTVRSRGYLMQERDTADGA